MHQTIPMQTFYYGFPVVLLTTCDEQGHSNISPISSSWCLGDNIVIGLGTCGKAFENLQVCPEAVLNLPDNTMFQRVESIAPFTGKAEIPKHKQGIYAYCSDKFAQGKLTAQTSIQVRPTRIAECPIQAEMRLQQISQRDGYAIIEFKIVQLHAQQHLVNEQGHIRPESWQPLIYNFRHYHGLSESLGKNFRAR
ncbi:MULTISPECIES: flavin reductase family protein [unclassified Lonepinella]|uniref:flavin reductase family protein n=1 Tax=unclassified Lonepinella TaxID=2642006 RepID=UPI003F6E3873